MVTDKKENSDSLSSLGNFLKPLFVKDKTLAHPLSGFQTETWEEMDYQFPLSLIVQKCVHYKDGILLNVHEKKPTGHNFLI